MIAVWQWRQALSVDISAGHELGRLVGIDHIIVW